MLINRINDEEYIGAEEVGHLLGCSTTYINQLVKAKDAGKNIDFPNYYYLGTPKRWWKLTEVEDWIIRRVKK